MVDPEYHILTAEQGRQLNEVFRWVRNFRVTGNAEFRNSSEGANLHVGGGGPAPGADDRFVSIKIQSVIAGAPGRYNAIIVRPRTPTTDVPTTGVVAEADYCSTADTTEVLAINTAETGSTLAFHLITPADTPNVFPGEIYWHNSDGRPVVRFNSYQGKACT